MFLVVWSVVEKRVNDAVSSNVERSREAFQMPQLIIAQQCTATGTQARHLLIIRLQSLLSCPAYENHTTTTLRTPAELPYAVRRNLLHHAA